jgi:hypothetical protein
VLLHLPPDHVELHKAVLARPGAFLLVDQDADGPLKILLQFRLGERLGRSDTDVQGHHELLNAAVLVHGLLQGIELEGYGPILNKQDCTVTVLGEAGAVEYLAQVIGNYEPRELLIADRLDF